MKGIVFREFYNMVEDVFSDDMMDQLIEATNPKSGGSYTTVGTYDYNELVNMVVELSKRTNTPVNDLIFSFGKHLASVFTEKYSDFFKSAPNTIEFLKTIDNHIHVEVKKLYPDAELPKFSFDDSNPNCLTLRYQSSRPFGVLAQGLIEGCSDYYHERLNIEMLDQSDDQASNVEFVISKAA